MAAPPPQGVPMDGLISTAPPIQPESAATAPPPAQAPQEIPCETLYIQNLNERIKPESSLNSYF